MLFRSYLDKKPETLDAAMDIITKAAKTGKAISVGLLGNGAEIIPEMLKRGIRPDALTDQTSAHDPLNGYLPAGWSVDEWLGKIESDPGAVERDRKASGRPCSCGARRPPRPASSAV